jgi:hypothetical protein
MNYVRFLKHHAPLPELIGLADDSSRNPLPTINEKTPRAASDRSALAQVSNKLRKVNIFLNYNTDQFFSLSFSYRIHINNCDEHLNNEIKQIVVPYL